MNFFHSRFLAIRRRTALLLNRDFDPYPPVPEGMNFSPSDHVKAVSREVKLQLDWATAEPDKIKVWQETARTRFLEILMVNKAIPRSSAEKETSPPVAGGYERRRIYMRFGPGSDAPIDIIRRAGEKTGKEDSTPVVICMQGTNSGAHLSLGEVRMPADVYKVARGSALALQAADQGYVAVSYERPCFGERRERELKSGTPGPTIDAAFHSLTVGETLLGQTVAELESLRQWISEEMAPGAPVYLAGYSAAGTTAVAAAAAFPGFAGIAVGGCIGMMRDTILRRAAAGYGNLPGILDWFESDALLALIAPRPCLVIAGVKDHIWPHSGAEKVVSSARKAWEQYSAVDALYIARADGGHTYYPDLMWSGLMQVAGRN